MATQTLTFRLDDSLIPALESEAAAKGCPRATYIQQIVQNHLTQDLAAHATKQLLDQTGETQQLLRAILQDTSLLKQIVAQKSREQSRDLGSLTSEQKAFRVDLATAVAAILEKACGVPAEDAIRWTEEYMPR